MSAMKPVALNRKAKFDYFLGDRYEAGIALQGCEVKSIREGRVNLADSFVRIIRDEVYLFNCHITPYSKMQGHVEVDPTRTRKLLLHRAEIHKLMGQVSKGKTTCVPTSMYFKKGKCKVEIAIATGKQHKDKRETIKRRIHQREADKAMKSHQQRNR